ncbi:MAG: hypothetical protein AB1696_16875 [Planctomycetota bacterium]
MDQGELLRYAIDILEELEITYMVVGALASTAYGDPRLTQDIDIVLDIRPDQLDALCGKFPLAEYYVSPEAAREAVLGGGQFNVIHPSSGNKIDFMIARNDPWGRSQIARRRRMRILPDLDGYVASPDDIIIGKMLYYREGGSEKHLRDITGILKISGDDVDRDYVAHWAAELGLTPIWQAIRKRIGEGAR